MDRPYYSDEYATIYHGDCREVMPLLSGMGHSFDLVLTDPPYASAAATVTTGFAAEKWGRSWGDMSLLPLMASQIFEQSFLAPDHEVYWFCDQYAFAALMPFFFRRYALTQSIIWDKDMLGVGGSYRKQTEFIIYARTADAPRMAKDRRDIIRLRPNYSEKEHPSAKPESLIRHLASATDWKKVLDPYAGAGVTSVTAKRLGRQSVSVEIEERYCEIAARRLSQEVLDLGGAA